MKSGNGIQIPLPDEHAFHLGWTSYNNGLPMSVNPYDLDAEEDLYNAWVEGYTSAEHINTV